MFFSPILLTFGLLFFWTALGWSLFAITAIYVGRLQTLLLAPVIGAAFTLILIFWLNIFLPVSFFARPLLIGLSLLAGATCLLKKPAWTKRDLTFFAPISAAILVFAVPSFHFGYDWMANANDDWANYNLSALRLAHDTFYQHPSLASMMEGRNYPGFYWFMLVSSGGRPGADLLLAWVSEVVGKSPFFIFMPLILTFHALLCFAGAAFAMETFGRRRLLAVVSLFALAPLGLYAVHQQLIAQILGLALMCATTAVTFVEFRKFRDFRYVVLVAVLVASFCLSYSELTPFFALAFIVYHGMHIRDGRWGWSDSWRVLIVPLIVAVMLGPYTLGFVVYVLSQFKTSFSQGAYDGISLFPYFLVPNGLAVLFGLSRLGEVLDEPFLSASIAVAVILLGGVAVGFAFGVKRQSAIGAYLAVFAVVVVVLVEKRNDFGLFKIAMFSQLFVWSAIVLAISQIRLPFGAAIYGVLLCLVAVTDYRIVLNSFEDRVSVGGLVGPSRRGLLTHVLGKTDNAGCNVDLETPNPVLLKIAAAVPNCPRDFLARPGLFSPLVLRAMQDVNEKLFGSLPGVKEFTEAAGKALPPPLVNLPFPDMGSARIETFRPSSNFGPIANVWPFVSVYRDSSEPVTNDLVLLNSNLGGYFYLPEFGRSSLYEAEPDLFFPNSRFAAAGRYLLFRLERPTRELRVLLDLTTSLLADGKAKLPPAAALGETRVEIGLVGHGAARMISPPLKPLIVDGVPYLLIDLGQQPQTIQIPRTGLMGLYGDSVPLDYRRIVAFIRKIRAVDAQEFNQKKPPAQVTRFPADLGNPDLEFSGIYEDGWVADDGFATLFSAASGRATIRGMVPNGIGINNVQLTISVGGEMSVTKSLMPGEFEIEIPVSAGKSRIEFHFSKVGRLPAPDNRPATALLSSIAIEP